MPYSLALLSEVAAAFRNLGSIPNVSAMISGYAKSEVPELLAKCTKIFGVDADTISQWITDLGDGSVLSQAKMDAEKLFIRSQNLSEDVLELWKSSDQLDPAPLKITKEVQTEDAVALVAADEGLEKEMSDWLGEEALTKYEHIMGMKHRSLQEAVDAAVETDTAEQEIQHEDLQAKSLANLNTAIENAKNLPGQFVPDEGDIDAFYKSFKLQELVGHEEFVKRSKMEIDALRATRKVLVRMREYLHAFSRLQRKHDGKDKYYTRAVRLFFDYYGRVAGIYRRETSALPTAEELRTGAMKYRGALGKSRRLNDFLDLKEFVETLITAVNEDIKAWRETRFAGAEALHMMNDTLEQEESQDNYKTLQSQWAGYVSVLSSHPAANLLWQLYYYPKNAIPNYEPQHNSFPVKQLASNANAYWQQKSDKSGSFVKHWGSNWYNTWSNYFSMDSDVRRRLDISENMRSQDGDTDFGRGDETFEHDAAGLPGHLQAPQPNETTGISALVMTHHDPDAPPGVDNHEIQLN